MKAGEKSHVPNHERARGTLNFEKAFQFINKDLEWHIKPGFAGLADYFLVTFHVKMQPWKMAYTSCFEFNCIGEYKEIILSGKQLSIPPLNSATNPLTRCLPPMHLVLLCQLP
jgi:hypothetical protein